MQVRLVWTRKDFRGRELGRREEVLLGESTKTPSRHYVARLIARHHPDLCSARQVFLGESFRPDFRWRVVYTRKLDTNCWEYVYANPIEDGVELAAPNQLGDALPEDGVVES